MSKQCVTHHFACDCREAMFKELEQKMQQLEHEHIALLEDKKRMDWLNTRMECHDHEEERFDSWLWLKAPTSKGNLRIAIDAARWKEAHP